MAQIVMPRLSDSMEEGTIVRWLKADGESVKAGEELVEIESDKATMVCEAEAEGVLSTIAGEGETLPVGAPIAQLGDAASPVPEPTSGQSAGGPRLQPAPASANGAAQPAAGFPPAAGSPPAASPPAASPPAASPPAATAPGRRVKASPLARRMARTQGIDIASIAGSGPGGRVVRRDVEAAAAGTDGAGANGAGANGAGAASGTAVGNTMAAAAATGAPGAGTPPDAGADPARARGAVTVQELSRAQQVIARRMSESRATVPEFEVRTVVDVQELLDLRAQLKAGGADPLPSVNDLIVKAAALALREHPKANGSYRDGHFELYERINVGVAAATEDGLVVPTVFDADTKSVGTIAGETRRLIARAREGTITPPELAGGTFTVSNLGMFGVSSFSAVIFQPQAAILSVGAAIPTPLAREGQVQVRAQSELTLACDHRILYGAEGAQLLGRIRGLLEQPILLLAG